MKQLNVPESMFRCRLTLSDKTMLRRSQNFESIHIGSGITRKRMSLHRNKPIRLVVTRRML